MKKILALVLLVTAVAFGWSYFFIPSTFTYTADIVIHAPAARSTKFIAQQSLWNKWWPATPVNNQFYYNNNRYAVTHAEANIIEMEIVQKDSSRLPGRMLTASKTMDSTAIEWNVSFKSSSNPFTRIRQYYGENNIRKDMNEVLNAFKLFAQRQDNIYGMFIEHDHVKDTVLVATRSALDHYPTTADIYGLVEKLRSYIKSQGASETNSPMLNVMDDGTSRYEIMVGIPTNRLLPGKGDIELKRMVKGNIIWGQVQGGNHTVIEAMKQIDNYKYDYRLTSPAIPFALLVTDRTKEPDTSKWVTRIYCPVF